MRHRCAPTRGTRMKCCYETTIERIRRSEDNVIASQLMPQPHDWTNTYAYFGPKRTNWPCARLCLGPSFLRRNTGKSGKRASPIALVLRGEGPEVPAVDEAIAHHVASGHAD